MKRGSPYFQLASSAQRGNHTPACQECAASIQERRWNSKSCPEAFPFQKNGEMMASAVTALRTADVARGQRRSTDPALCSGLGCTGKCLRIQNPSKQSHRCLSNCATEWQP